MLQRIVLLMALVFSPLLWAQSMINLNTADAIELQQLNGIGEKKALLIVEYREQIGAFSSIEQLTNVKGVGEATLDKNRAVLTVESTEPVEGE